LYGALHARGLLEAAFIAGDGGCPVAGDDDSSVAETELHERRGDENQLSQRRRLLRRGNGRPALPGLSVSSLILCNVVYANLLIIQSMTVEFVGGQPDSKYAFLLSSC